MKDEFVYQVARCLEEQSNVLSADEFTTAVDGVVKMTVTLIDESQYEISFRRYPNELTLQESVIRQNLEYKLIDRG